MNRVITIDPGTPGCGVAYWVDGRLSLASYVKGDAYEVWREMPGADLVVIECPMTYENRPSKDIDINDLIKLAIRVGELKIQFEVESDAEVRLIEPPDWKRQVPKDICKSRAERELAGPEAGNVHEPKNKKTALDMWDAVGIGLVVLKRLRPGLV
jgi:hypothetical protein